MTTEQSIERRETPDYPTRYAAFETPHVIWWYSGDKITGAREAGIYKDPIQNETYPHITDGIYGEISRREGRYIKPGYWITCHATRPDASREQWSDNRFISNFIETPQSRREAEAALESLIHKAEAWLRGTRA